MHTSVESSKRQLPPWMMHKVGATATRVCDSDNAVETNCKKGDIIAVNATNKDHNREPLRKKANLRAKREVKGRKKIEQEDGSCENVTQKKKKGDMCKEDRDQRSSLKKRKKLEDHNHVSFAVHPDQASSDDAMDLTVEDLMVIAEQYVKDNENKDRKEISSRHCESKLKFQVTNETETTLDSPCENKNSSGSRRETLSNSTSTTDELIATSTSQTGDPAQDMLDLFLGPLLRTTLEKEKSKSIVENIEIIHDFTRQSQDEHAGQEIVPLVKKRNTLKDKVAMFLDQDM